MRPWNVHGVPNVYWGVGHFVFKMVRKNEVTGAPLVNVAEVRRSRLPRNFASFSPFFL